MKKSAKLVLLMLFLCGCLFSFSTQAQSGDAGVVDKFIAGLAEKEDGSEAEGIRKLIDGDLNHDGVPDAAVLFTIEGQSGTNNYVQYLAVFLRKSGHLVYAAHARVGGKNRRSMDLISIKDNLMILDTTAYAKNDPSCCPTIKGRTRYALVGSKLTEMRRK